MVEHLLCVIASDARAVPARVCGLLAQRSVEVSSIQMAKPAGSTRWWIQLVVCLDRNGDVELVVKWLNRLVDVVKVVDLGSEPNRQRRSVFVRLRPSTADLIHVNQLVHLFGAEVVEVTPDITTLYLSATPARCEQFVAMLEPYTVVEAVPGAVSGLRSDSPPAMP